MKKLQKSIQKLAAYRDEYLCIKHRSPSFERACQILGLSPETVRIYSPELVEKWYDSEFHWSTSSADVSTTPSDEEITSKI
jgi:hypothetical protein